MVVEEGEDSKEKNLSERELLRARSHYVYFGLTQSRTIFCVSERVNTPMSRSYIKRSFWGKVWVMKYRGRESFCPVLFTRRNKGYDCLVRMIDRRASSASFFFFFFFFFFSCWPQPCRGQCFYPAFFSATAIVQFAMKWTNEIAGKNLELWTMWLTDGATSMVVGLTGESRCQEQWNPWKQSGQSPQKGRRPYPQNDFFYDENDSTSNVSLRWRMSQRTAVEVIRWQGSWRNAKKCRRNGVNAGTPLRWRHCVWCRVFAIFFFWRHGNLEKRSCLNPKKYIYSVPRP